MIIKFISISTAFSIAKARFQSPAFAWGLKAVPSTIRLGIGFAAAIFAAAFVEFDDVAFVATVIILSILIGQFLDTNTNAELPFLDAFTTFGAIVTTYMVAMKILENWIYWFVIDSISIYLFITRELYLTSILFLIYLVIIVFGYFRWRKIFLTNNE